MTVNSTEDRETGAGIAWLIISSPKQDNAAVKSAIDAILMFSPYTFDGKGRIASTAAERLRLVSQVLHVAIAELGDR